MNTYNEETVGTGQNTVNYGKVIEHLRAGGIASRLLWNGEGMFIFKQVPSIVPAEVVPKMSSLPDSAKERFIAADTAPHYVNQMVIVQDDGMINSWVASSSDTFAVDWILN